MNVYGFNSDGSISVKIDGVDMIVPDDMTNRHRQTVAEWEAEGNEIPPYVPPEISTTYQLYKSVFINRMTESEAQIMEVVLVEAPAKLRMLFNSVEYFVSDDPLFYDLHESVKTALGESRATELLAPNEP